MIYLLDTCTISYFFRKDINVIENFKHQSPANIKVSAISVMEIDYGLALNLPLKQKLLPIWQSLLAQIEIIPFDIKDAQLAAEIRANLKIKGSPIGAYDLLLGATALRHGFHFVTANTKEFDRINNLNVVNWQTEFR